MLFSAWFLSWQVGCDPVQSVAFVGGLEWLFSSVAVGADRLVVSECRGVVLFAAFLCW